MRSDEEKLVNWAKPFVSGLMILVFVSSIDFLEEKLKQYLDFFTLGLFALAAIYIPAGFVTGFAKLLEIRRSRSCLPLSAAALWKEKLLANSVGLIFLFCSVLLLSDRNSTGFILIDPYLGFAYFGLLGLSIFANGLFYIPDYLALTDDGRLWIDSHRTHLTLEHIHSATFFKAQRQLVLTTSEGKTCELRTFRDQRKISSFLASVFPASKLHFK